MVQWAAPRSMRRIFLPDTGQVTVNASIHSSLALPCTTDANCKEFVEFELNTSFPGYYKGPQDELYCFTNGVYHSCDSTTERLTRLW